MRILVLSDVHANLTALEAVLAAAGTVDAVWCLGDIVGYGPDPRQCIEVIQSQPNLLCVLGNHDAAALDQIALEAFNYEAQQSIRWLRSELTHAHRGFLESLPDKLVTGDVTLAHGSPRNPVWEYLLDPFTATENFDSFDTAYCFVGHTHLPLAYVYRSDGQVTREPLEGDAPLYLTARAILNPGSTGQPRDHDPRAAYAIYDDEQRTWQPCRVAYDVRAVQRRILSAGLPERHAMRLLQGW